MCALKGSARLSVTCGQSLRRTGRHRSGETLRSRPTRSCGAAACEISETSFPRTRPQTQRVSADVASAGNARQQLLFLARPQIPAILWVVVFVSGGLLIFLQVSDAHSQGKIVWRTMLIAVIVVMTLEVASLAVLDRPFSPIAGIQPTAMTDAIGLLTACRTDLPTMHECALEGR